MSTPLSRPPSAIPAADGYAGLAGLLAGWALVALVHPPQLVGAWMLLMATATPMLWLELRRAGPAQRQPTTTPFAPTAWLVGFIFASLPFLAIHGQHRPLAIWIAAWAVSAPALAVVLVLERRRGLPAGGELAQTLGRFVLRQGPRPGWAALRQWGLKAFFIPLYGASLYFLTDMVLAAPSQLARAVAFAYSIDLAFGLSGYLFATKALPGAIRSTQPLLFGWVVCILCYGPVFHVWPAAEAMVSREIRWPGLIGGDPASIALAAAMIALLTLYVWASVSFGLRFSNLSNRGVITHGPYRWMKHPAYFAHAANAWVISAMLALNSELQPWWPLVPLAFTTLYTLRALTEERHMSEEADYRAYAAFIAEHGLLARLTGRRRRTKPAVASERPSW